MADVHMLKSNRIVFNSSIGTVDSGRGSFSETSLHSKPSKKTRSPFELHKSTKASRATPQGLTSITPIKGNPLESPFKHGSILPLATSIESPILMPSPAMAWKQKESTLQMTSDMPVTISPLKKQVSPTDSGIELPKFPGESPTLSMSVSPSKINPKIRTMYNGHRREVDETTEFSLNPDPVPYQPSNFMAERFGRLEDPSIFGEASSTMMKKMPVSRRHLDSFGSGMDLATSLSKRGVMLHTDRYQWDIAQALDGLSQRERHLAEMEYMEKLRGIKRRREVLPHRAQLDLLMGGKKIEFTERYEIQREIQKLRSLILPQHAKDLFHGRGFTLPETHNSIKPRRLLPTDIDLEEDFGTFSPDKYSFNPETGRLHPKWQKQGGLDHSNVLPKINSKGYLLENFRAQKGEPIPVKTPNPFSYEMEDTFTPFVTRQSTLMSPAMPRSCSRSPAVYSPRKQRFMKTNSPDLTLYPTSQGLMSSPRGYGTGAGQPVYMTRSKTQVHSGQPKNVAARSVTAVPGKKDAAQRPTATAPPVKPGSDREIKIPGSVQDTEPPPDVAPEPSPSVPKSTPAPPDNKPIVDEELAGGAGKDLDGRLMASQMSTARSSAATPNPLKGIELHSSLTDEEQSRLKQTFNKLDTDKDGHLKFSQLQTQLPKKFSQSQEKYIKQVYDITSSSTFFGVDEFMTMSYLTSVVTSLSGEPLESFDELDFHNLNDTILKYVDLFQKVDRSHRGKIALASLQDILGTALARDMHTDTQTWNRFMDTVSLTDAGHISKIEFLANIPFFQSALHWK